MLTSQAVEALVDALLSETVTLLPKSRLKLAPVEFRIVLFEKELPLMFSSLMFSTKLSTTQFSIEMLVTFSATIPKPLLFPEIVKPRQSRETLSDAIVTQVEEFEILPERVLSSVILTGQLPITTADAPKDNKPTSNNTKNDLT